MGFFQIWNGVNSFGKSVLVAFVGSHVLEPNNDGSIFLDLFPRPLSTMRSQKTSTPIISFS
jgi:hypothetical protein